MGNKCCRVPAADPCPMCGKGKLLIQSQWNIESNFKSMEERRLESCTKCKYCGDFFVRKTVAPRHDDDDDKQQIN